MNDIFECRTINGVDVFLSVPTGFRSSGFVSNVNRVLFFYSKPISQKLFCSFRLYRTILSSDLFVNYCYRGQGWTPYSILSYLFTFCPFQLSSFSAVWKLCILENVIFADSDQNSLFFRFFSLSAVGFFSLSRGIQRVWSTEIFLSTDRCVCNPSTEVKHHHYSKSRCLISSVQPSSQNLISVSVCRRCCRCRGGVCI